MKKLSIFFLAFWLSACGFHLRGMGADAVVKFKSVYLEGASGPLRAQFVEQLRASSAKLVGTPKGADLQVKVTEEKFQSRTLSLNFSGRSNEYELNYRVKYQLAGSNNTFLPMDKPLEILRAYYNDQQDILAKNNEEQVIRKEMYEQAVRSILDRAQAQIHANAK